MSELELKKIEQTYQKLRGHVRETPVLLWDGLLQRKILGASAVYLKLEFLQHSGSFKVRGAFSSMLEHLEQVRRVGVVAVSRGNHACAVSYGARELGGAAKVIIPRDVSQRRIIKSRIFGAEVIFVEDVLEAFAVAKEVEKKEGRLLVHPYDGEPVALGTACVGKEFTRQVPQLEEIYVACGGGGLLSGVSAWVKQVMPQCKVFGVEPEGAAAMTRSLKQGKLVALDSAVTIADSLGTPHCGQLCFELCQKYVDDMVVVSDLEIITAMKYLYQDMTLVFEPAGVAALAGAIKRGSGAKHIGVILCGANIELSEYQDLLRDKLGKRRT